MVVFFVCRPLKARVDTASGIATTVCRDRGETTHRTVNADGDVPW